MSACRRRNHQSLLQVQKLDLEILLTLEGRKLGSANRTMRIRVEGSRRVCNTYIHASTKSVENAISRFCKIEGLNIKRKTRTNNRTGKLNWWFVIHGEENTLCELESKWETLHTQTSWVLEKCTRPSDSASSSSNTIQQSHSAPENPASGNHSDDPDTRNQTSETQMDEYLQATANVPLPTDSPATSSPSNNSKD